MGARPPVCSYLPTQRGPACPYRTRPLVFRSTEAAKLWVTPTRLVPSTSTRRSFTWILGEATLVRGAVRGGTGAEVVVVSLHQKPEAQSPPGSWYFVYLHKMHGARGLGISQTRHWAVRPGQANPMQAGRTKHTSCHNHTLVPSSFTPDRVV